MHLSRALTAKLAACILAVTAVISPSFAASVGTVVSDSGLNIRAEASAESQVLTTLSSGTQVDVLSTTGDGKWHKISYNGTTGFVTGDYLKVTEEKIYGQVVAGPLNVRSGPSAGAEKVDSLSVGTIVEIEELIGGAGGWYQIDGGYVSSDYVAQVDAGLIRYRTELEATHRASLAAQLERCDNRLAELTFGKPERAKNATQGKEATR